MNIIMATSEVVPFAKTGGLADVCGALPAALARLGHEVTVFMPAYRYVRRSGRPLEPTDIHIDIPIGSKVVPGRLLRSELPGSGVAVYLVEQDGYFDRAELYREGGDDYKDNCERFVFFCRAVMESIRLLELPADILHCHDWQTGLLPAYLNVEYRHAAGYDQIATLLTIHNMAYQGQFWHWDMLLTGLDWKYFNWRQMEFYGNLNLLKTGLVFADAITTVSPTYADEIQSEPLGCGLSGVLQDRAADLSGIMNGADYSVWNPATDDAIAQNYDARSWREGKAACKAALQTEFGLPANPRAPLLGFVGRLASQKGIDLIASTLSRWGETRDAQWVFLGTGEPEYHQMLEALAARFPDKVAVKLAFSDVLAHKIEAGCDMFLMPSQFEPCGLNQLYSLKYGAVPVVHATGGLADSITDANAQTLAEGTANGFAFREFTVASFENALERACAAYAQNPATWEQIVATGMRQDWSWDNSAREYVKLYERLMAKVHSGVEV